jgi:glycosyltransferase involved in cell wall biosynthesis
MKEFSLIITYHGVNEERFFHLLNCIGSLDVQSLKNFEVIIVSDSKKEFEFSNECSKAPYLIPKISFPLKILNISTPRLGFALNEGFKKAEKEFIVIAQEDHIFDRDYFKILAEHAEKGYLICGKIYGSRGNYKELMRSWDHADGMDACIHRDDWEPFDEEFDTGSDSHVYVEWLYRLWKKIKFKFIPELIRYHQYHSYGPEHEERVRKSYEIYKRKIK